jgi:hypothetical protein
VDGPARLPTNARMNQFASSVSCAFERRPRRAGVGCAVGGLSNSWTRKGSTASYVVQVFGDVLDGESRAETIDTLL